MGGRNLPSSTLWKSFSYFEIASLPLLCSCIDSSSSQRANATWEMGAGKEGGLQSVDPLFDREESEKFKELSPVRVRSYELLDGCKRGAWMASPERERGWDEGREEDGGRRWGKEGGSRSPVLKGNPRLLSTIFSKTSSQRREKDFSLKS